MNVHRHDAGSVGIAALLGLALFVGVGAIVVVGFVRDAQMQDAPTVTECVDDWNARIGEPKQQLVAAEGYRSASVAGHFHDFAGCTVEFIGPGAHPFLVRTCFRAFSTSDPAGVGWSCDWDTASQAFGLVARVESGWRLTLAP